MPLYGTQQMGVYHSSDDEDSSLESGSGSEEEEEEEFSTDNKKSVSDDEASSDQEDSSNDDDADDSEEDADRDEFPEGQSNSIDEIFPDVPENSEDFADLMEESDDQLENPNGDDNMRDDEPSEESTIHADPLPRSVKFQFSPSPSGCLPHIMYFPKAPPPPESLQSSKNSKPKDPLVVKVLKSKDARRTTQRVVLAETSRMEYVGTNFGRDGRDINKYMVGVYDKERKKVRLIDSSHIFSMQQTIKSYEEQERDLSVGDWRQSNRLLVETFGSKRARTDLNKAIRDQVTENNINADTMEFLNKSISDKIDHTPTLESLQSGPRSDLPPFDINAKCVQDVYKTTDVIFEELRVELNKLVKTELIPKSTQELQEKVLDDSANGYPKSCSFHLANFATSSEKKDLGCFILFLIYLIRFFKYFRGSALDIKKGAQKTNIPIGVFSHMADMFASKAFDLKSNRVRLLQSDQLKTKLINYILIVHLILSGYKMNVTPIAKDLKIDDRRIKDHCRLIGCTTTGGRKTITTRKGVNAVDAESAPDLDAELTIPLSFGEPEYMRKGKPKRR